MRTEALVSSSAQTLHFLICIWGLPKNEHLDYSSALPLLSASCCLSSCISKNWKAQPFTSLFLWFILLMWVISLPFAVPWISLKGGRRAWLCPGAGAGPGEGVTAGAVPPPQWQQRAPKYNFCTSPLPPLAESNEVCGICEGRKVGMGK